MSTKNKLEQILHFLFLGILPGMIFGPLAISIPLIRELTRWSLPWPMKGQWPPGDTAHIEQSRSTYGYRKAWKPEDQSNLDGTNWGEPYQPLDRVNDMRWDLVFTFAGIGVGQAIQIGLLVKWLV
jgi:hypothetical protein